MRISKGSSSRYTRYCVDPRRISIVHLVFEKCPINVTGNDPANGEYIRAHICIYGYLITDTVPRLRTPLGTIGGDLFLEDRECCVRGVGKSCAFNPRS